MVGFRKNIFAKKKLLLHNLMNFFLQNHTWVTNSMSGQVIIYTYGHVLSTRSEWMKTTSQLYKICSYTLIWASFHSLLLEYLRGVMASILPEVALYGSKNECARTDHVFLPISEVRNDTVSLIVCGTKLFVCFNFQLVNSEKTSQIAENCPSWLLCQSV